MALIKVTVEPVVAQTIYRGGKSDVEAYAAAHPDSAVNFLRDHRDKVEKFTYLRPEAAHSFMDLQAAWYEKGGELYVSDMLRTVDVQIDLKKRKPTLAARPGNSLHGHGLAVDYDTANLGRDKETDRKFHWKDFDKHVQEFGWVVYERAYRDGKECWHIEMREYPPSPFKSASEFISRIDDVGLSASMEEIHAAIWRVAKLAGYNGSILDTAIKEVQKLARIKEDGDIGRITRQAVAKLDIEYVRVESTYDFEKNRVLWENIGRTDFGWVLPK